MSLNVPSPGDVPSPRQISLTWFLVCLLVVGGLAIGGTAAYFEVRPATGHGALILTDDLGRTGSIPVNPSRVVVLSPNIMDSMYRLGLRSHVVGVDCYSAAFGGLSADYSADQVARWGLTDSMCVQVGPTLDIEKLLNLTPQLVLASTIVSVAAVETITHVHHLPVVMLQPPTLSGVLIDVNLLAEIFGVAGTASRLNSALQVELGNTSAILGKLSGLGTPFPTVLVTYSVDAGGYWTYGPGTFGQSLIELAGATSISANATLPYPELPGERVLASDPQFLVYGTGYGLNLTSYAVAPFWSQLHAVRYGHAAGMDSNYLTEPDPTMILVGLPQLLALFHPGVTP
jgi:iron complex transport system substrate-binding protein